MKKLILLAIFLALFVNDINANPLPNWNSARRIMNECYSGWDAIVTVNAGLKSEYSFNEYEDRNVLSIAGEQNIDTANINTGNLGTTSNYGAAYDMYASDKATNAEYSRDRLQNNAYIGLFITVPLYSRETRLKRKESTNRQIEHIADLYATYEGHRATASSIESESKILKRVMLDGGHDVIRSYYGMIAQKEKSIALMNSSRRKIFMILERCGYVERNGTVRKGRSFNKKDKAKT